MRKTLIFISILIGLAASSRAQTALDFNEPDCHGTYHHLFDDLDSGNAVILFFYMPSCGTCPPPAAEIQTMADNLLLTYPGKIKAYVRPYNNTTTCSSVSSWVGSYGLHLFTPYDSGAYQAAYYGGFAMPSVVLLGGTDHKILFIRSVSDGYYTTADTAIMRDSILGLFLRNGVATSIKEIQTREAAVEIYPNPAHDQIQLQLPSACTIRILNVQGQEMYQSVVSPDQSKGKYAIDCSQWPKGTYWLHGQSTEASFSKAFQLVE